MSETFSIIMLAFNNRVCTKRCLDSLLAGALSPYELLAVDNGSMDGTGEMLEEHVKRFAAAGRRMTVTHHATNTGAVRGRNLAMEAARGKYVVFLDNDVYAVEPGWLEKLERVLETQERAGIVGPTMVFAWDPGLIQFAGGGVSRTGRVQFIGRGERADDERFGRVRDVQFVISACMMFRRELVEEIGALDEAYSPVQYEDIDFCYRARARGHRVLYVPDVRMLHDESATTAASPTLKNKYLVIRHGMIFKERWRHMFENENGPADSQTAWKRLGRFGQ